MHIDELTTELNQNSANEISIPKNWAQGRTVYGGLTAALIFNQMNNEILAKEFEESRRLLYLNLSFIGPVFTLKNCQINATIIRSGRTATQLTASVKQDGKTCVMAQGCFAIKRASVINITNINPVEMNLPKKPDYLPQIPKVVPKFLRHFDLSLQKGRWPFMRSQLDSLEGWMRLKKPPKNFHDEHLIATIDSWPSTVIQQLKLPAPASTMNWNLEFPQTRTKIEPNQWLAYSAKTNYASDGYVFSDAKVMSQNNEILALSRQTVAVFG